MAGPTVRTTSLDSAAGLTWTVRPLTAVPPEAAAASRGVPSAVPGEVVSDLLGAGLIPDPFDADHEVGLAWIGRTDWEYRTTFTFTDGGESRHDLVAAGLDTIARLTLNGTVVGRAANQHRTHRFDVSSLLVEGENTLVVVFEGPVTAAHRRSEELGERPRALGHPFNAVRKMAAGYGWDWGIDIAGVGIWKSIGIESWSGVRLASVRPLARVEGTTGRLETHLELEWSAADDLPGADLSVTVDGRTERATVRQGQLAVTVVVEVPSVRRWWPVGYGPQERYAVTAAVGGQRRDFAVGFRSVRLRTEPDAVGTEFTLLVNDEPVYVKGANWIPDDALLTRLGPDRYRRAVGEAAAAGMNLLRVWGGGIYESEDFYAVCDELGILVWQDFLFACAAYSEDEPLRSEVEAEAREAVTRLSAHPSLAMWNGNNENIWGYVEWGWRPALAGRSWGEGYYTELLPAIVAELDPRTPYSPGSPFSYASYVHPNDPRHGTVHEWEVWNRVDYRHYRDRVPRFVSEFGFQGPPAWSTLTSVVHDQPLDPYGPQMLGHQKAEDGNLKLERGLGDHLPPWTTIEDWHWITSLNQARAVAYGIEHFRSHYPVNRGAVVWQLNDNWPVISWAALDYAGIRKPLWHALKRVYADRLLTVQPRADADGRPVPVVVAHNDSPDAWDTELVVTRRGVGAGTPPLAEQRVPLHLDPRSACTLPLDAAVQQAGDPTGELLSATADGAETAFGYFVEDTALTLTPPAAALTAAVAPTEAGYRVTVTASALVKDITLFPDRLDPAARVDTALVTLLAGESHTFAVSGPRLDEVALLSPPVLRCVNDLP